MAVDDLLANGEPNAQTKVAFGFGGVVKIKYSCLKLEGYSAAVVFKTDFYQSVVLKSSTDSQFALSCIASIALATRLVHICCSAIG